MKFNFRIQDYQTDAVKSVVDCFEGQPYVGNLKYRRDIGTLKDKKNFSQTALNLSQLDSTFETEDDNLNEIGFKNEKLHINSDILLKNINRVQQKNNIIQSNSLMGDKGECTLDIEMETGTGKTYVYTKTMYELNKKYGWSKFVVVVPSIAIREGVKKSFEITQNHFMENYNQKIRFFIYNSDNLQQLDSFSTNSGINVMIINMQSFNSSLKKDMRRNSSRIIYSERDEFGSRRPIDVIKANNPILILDEPQKMGGTQTQKGLKKFNPLFTLNYSATHTNQHNLVYALDAVDAYNKKLVKKIEVKGFEVKNLRGTSQYLYLQDIIVSPNNPPKAKIEFGIKYKKGIERKTRIVTVDDNLYEISNSEQYKGFRVSDINYREEKVSFINGEEIFKGVIQGDDVKDKVRRVQIRETIKSHLEKEEILYNKGIKTLSLFFIDEVSKYKKYNKVGGEEIGEYGIIFEEEYQDLVAEKIENATGNYKDYLEQIPVINTHNGYFSIDKKGRVINGELEKYSDISSDISAYDLILKDKERLLSFEEPTRFIFSHTALREGWDNPNIFQICTLKQGYSTVMKRQEVGRGLRLCVDQKGHRMDKYQINESEIHDINKLTVIASESYKDFVSDLQKEMKENLYDRPRKATPKYFEGKMVHDGNKIRELTEEEAIAIYQYLIRNNYVDKDSSITSDYHIDVENNNTALLPEKLSNLSDEIHKLIQSVFDDSILDEMIDDGHQTKIIDNDLNENFEKEEFKKLWSNINHKYSYKVKFDSNELIDKSVNYLNRELSVDELKYKMTVSEQKDKISSDELNTGDSFELAETETKDLNYQETSPIKYDLIGKIAEKTTLTRKTVAQILRKIQPETFEKFRKNPEQFIQKVSDHINEQKSTMLIEHITYNKLDEKYDSSIFTEEKQSSTLAKAFKAKKHIRPYVFTDGYAEDSVEKRFAKSLDGAREVSVYSKLPRGFLIPTPVGNYNPDWAIAFEEGSVKHIFFIAETKGTMNSLEISTKEKLKIESAKKLFNEISTEDIVYHEVESYERLLNIMPDVKKNKK